MSINNLNPNPNRFYRSNLRDVYRHVGSLEVFNYNPSAERVLGNLFSRYTTESTYVVYSYGYHYPLLIKFAGIHTWFVNGTRYSNTTTRHRSFATKGIDHTDLQELPTEQMQELHTLDTAQFVRLLLGGYSLQSSTNVTLPSTRRRSVVNANAKLNATHNL